MNVRSGTAGLRIAAPPPVLFHVPIQFGIACTFGDYEFDACVIPMK
jgi:hypothetical protein